MRGLPGSGKTTAVRAKFPDAFVVSRDVVRSMLFNAPKSILEPWKEELVSKVCSESASEALKNGLTVVIDDMNLRPKYLRPWKQMAETLNSPFLTYEMPVDVELSIQRDAARQDSVGEEVIRKLAGKFIRKGWYLPLTEVGPQGPLPRKYIPDLEAPPAILVDIDGTAASNISGRSFYDWGRVNEDIPDPVVVEVVSILSKHFRIIFMTGRDAVCRQATQEWLEEAFSNADFEKVLVMRGEGDMRPDAIVKQELFFDHVAPYFNVRLALDDRDSVVKMWRDIGIKTFQVGYGNF